MLAINSIVGTMLSDLLWALSIQLLNPTLCTVGLSLTIPLSILVDMMLHHLQYSLVYWIGTSLIVGGFLLMCMFEYPKIQVFLTNQYLLERFKRRTLKEQNLSLEENTMLIQEV